MNKLSEEMFVTYSAIKKMLHKDGKPIKEGQARNIYKYYRAKLINNKLMQLDKSRLPTEWLINQISKDYGIPIKILIYNLDNTELKKDA